MIFWRLEEAQSRWEQQSVDNPPFPRTNHTTLVLNELMYIYGGLGPDGQALSDMYVYDPNTNTCSEIDYSGVSPSGRWDAASVVTPDGTFWLAGGWTDWGADNQLWSYIFATNTWQQ